MLQTATINRKHITHVTGSQIHIHKDGLDYDKNFKECLGSTPNDYLSHILLKDMIEYIGI